MLRYEELARSFLSIAFIHVGRHLQELEDISRRNHLNERVSTVYFTFCKSRSIGNGGSEASTIEVYLLRGISWDMHYPNRMDNVYEGVFVFPSTVEVSCWSEVLSWRMVEMHRTVPIRGK